MGTELSRRAFLKVSGLAVSGAFLKPPPPEALPAPSELGRVATSQVGVYSEPSFHARRLTLLPRDTLVTLLSRENSDDGPAYNPLWWRTPDGYMHSGNLQLVRWEPQLPLPRIPEGGAVFEVSVPATRSYREPDPESNPLYRLYYQSTAWIEAAVEGADDRTWYQIVDDRLRVRYYTRGEHLRRIEPSELTPISPDVPLAAKRIVISLARQELMAFEDSELVLRTRIASGAPSRGPTANGIPTETPRGRFHVQIKTPLRHMGDGRLTSSLEAYELPGVPWCSFFVTSTGVALHGTYWHNDFGRPRSHGCVNMRIDEAKWLFRWCMPVSPPDKILTIGLGTSVVVE
ncbi:MAG: L,D-transpeptidase [Chloroflexota bacterium]